MYAKEWENKTKQKWLELQMNNNLEVKSIVAL